MGRDRLKTLESVIRGKRSAFYEIGEALREIRDGKLYRDPGGFKTFDDYCRDRWAMPRQHAYRHIDAIDVRERLSPLGDILPDCERHIRPLAALEPDQQIEAWQEVVSRAAGGAITAKLVTEVVAGFKGETADDSGPFCLFAEIAAVQRVLDRIIAGWPKEHVAALQDHLRQVAEKTPVIWESFNGRC